MVTWLSLVFGGGFLVGVVTLLALEALGLLLLIRRLNRKEAKAASSLLLVPPDGSSSLDPQQSVDYAYNKKGVVWILEADKVPKVEKVPKEQKKKREFIEVTPVKKFASIKDRSLVLRDPDGSQIVVQLKGCIVDAVSATGLPSRKWAKRFPIKVESTTSPLYNANKIIYIYLETSWEKESWCKALRLASCDDEERLKWVTQLNEQFHQYLTSLNTGYPSFMKPSALFSAEPTEIDRISRIDGSGSKVRLFFKKLARKASKTGIENRVISVSNREDKKINEKCQAFQDLGVASTLTKTASTAKPPAYPVGENLALPAASTLAHSVSQSHISVASDIDSDDKFNIDDGTLCWNLLISRLFFDAKISSEIKNSVKVRIQRTLSNMRIPSYIGEVICTDLHLGELPPYIHGIRVLPMDMNEVWSWEVDIEYCRGVVLDIETRLEVRDLDLQKGTENSGSSSTGDIPQELLEDFEYLGEQLNHSEGSGVVKGHKDVGDPKLDRSKSSTSGVPATVSRWKSIVNSVAKQVSQVPISLTIRVASLHGTVRAHIKPPPSDQLWYGFTSMPDIQFGLESSVGEHKITSGHVASYLINKFKAAIRETMVLPNCESVTIPWMLGEKNDWVPRKVAPFMWLNQESTGDRSTPNEASGVEPINGKANMDAGRRTPSDNVDSRHSISTTAECIQRTSCSSSDASLSSSKSLNELRTPLLGNGEAPDGGQERRVFTSERRSPSRSLTSVERQNHATEDDDLKPKKIGKRAKMLDLGKRMSEKLEEKRRHIEEKGRNIVEKMRAPS
ncbi:hypothetical protein Tsubulata_006320 [Turnera subulata]|uniref:SMP-LTD domain-containing protein n=1 Tax=Turnera subulata TaxID=218843 RepID=A0A9Q0JK12_9ROSI|nr:hypothetical protein Tsubulata_006320 [Turnera subulata]